MQKPIEIAVSTQSPAGAVAHVIDPLKAAHAVAFAGGQNALPGCHAGAALAAPTNHDLLEMLAKNQDTGMAHFKAVYGNSLNKIRSLAASQQNERTAIASLSPEELQVIGALRAAIGLGDPSAIGAAVEQAQSLGRGSDALALGHLFRPLQIEMQRAGLTFGKGYDIIRNGSGQLGVMNKARRISMDAYIYFG